MCHHVPRPVCLRGTLWCAGDGRGEDDDKNSHHVSGAAPFNDTVGSGEMVKSFRVSDGGHDVDISTVPSRSILSIV